MTNSILHQPTDMAVAKASCFSHACFAAEGIGACGLCMAIVAAISIIKPLFIA